MHLVLLSTGGTIFQKVDPVSGGMAIGVGLFDVLQPQWLQQLQARQQQRLQQWQQQQQEQQREQGGGAVDRRAWPPSGRGAGAAVPPVVLRGWTHVDLRARSGAELGFDTIFAARDAVRQQLQLHSRDEAAREPEADGQGTTGSGVGGAGSGGCGVCFVLVTGTDTLEEFAFTLDLLLGLELAAAGCPLVVTGAMKPYDIEGYDGAANMQQAVQVALCRAAGRWGVLVCLNDAVQSARWAAKADSQLMGAFRSPQPGGAVAQVREGCVRFYYGPPPDDDAGDGGDGGGLCVRDPRFAALTAADVAPWSRVGIWTTAVSGFIPAELLRPPPPPAAAPPPATAAAGQDRQRQGADGGGDGSHEGAGAASEARGAGGAAPEGCGGGGGGLVGLVVAAPGTGSLSAALTDQLAAAASRLPVVLVSRCGCGANADDHYYRGSAAKYSGRGLLLEGFPHCNALQARVLLVLRLAAGLYPQYSGGGGGTGGSVDARDGAVV
ncbi:hypothetical protein HXX76_015637 [Chlamydomonas incerta]|uniref:asparaginase n=1 Tax=Chlamydomonas incerta TaxID=51695 RepID=A0A835VRQ1_CHLIN|nr:hypothetical protein HXX76_015637 [Chlamydomonas incerta]|eukprot:KAG2422966.1 hypothetical protein HXX76_015637 [Chlamydomonas incerta]